MTAHITDHFDRASLEVLGVKVIPASPPAWDTIPFHHWLASGDLPERSQTWAQAVRRTVHRPSGGVPVRRLLLLPPVFTSYVKYVTTFITHTVQAGGEDAHVAAGLRLRCADGVALRQIATLLRVPCPPELLTKRLTLRRWKRSDRPLLAALNADPVVMRYFPGTLSSAQTDHFVDVVDARFETDGFGLWAVEVNGQFVGYTGLSKPRFQAAFTPTVEIGWRLAQHAWGHGYATEAATAALDDAFARIGLPSVVAYTAAANQPSRRVMHRLAMTHDPAEDFDHPQLPPASPLRRHVLYRLTAADWAASTDHQRWAAP